MAFNRITYKFTAFCVVVLMIVFWIFSGGWFWGRLKLVESTEFLMNTSVTVKIYVTSNKKGKDLLKRTFTEAKRIEHILEPLKGEGELYRINNSRADKWWKMSPDMEAVLQRSIFFNRMSGGVFDPTIAPIKWLWDFENGGRLPSGSEIKEALNAVGLSHITVMGDSLTLGNHGTKLDFGGIAKGYTVDRMISLLKAEGIDAGLVNAGGDIFTFGMKPGGKPWVIGLRHPRMNKTYVLETISLPAVATSGDYERCFINEGVRYHHILDPATGYPARGCASVTVWTKTAMDADVLATSIFVLGPQKGLALAEKMEDVETLIFFEEDSRIKNVMSSGIKDIIKL